MVLLESICSLTFVILFNFLFLRHKQRQQELYSVRNESGKYV